MKILISGAGIAGPTLAYWLKHYGFEPTLVERAPHLRARGYIIDFWGLGYDVAERMGLRPELERKGYKVREVRFVNERGRRTGGFSTAVFDRLTHGRFISLPRGELAAALFRSLNDQVETIFGDEITALEEHPGGVTVHFAHAAPRDFDLVIGADGLHSPVRRLAFGTGAGSEKYLGYKVAAFETTGYRPRDADVYVMYTQVGQQVARFTMRENRTMFLFVFAESTAAEVSGESAQKRRLHERFGNAGWECPEILRALDAADDLYFDRVSQIRLPEWSRGRVALVGDAAYCVSLLAGQGSALAMAGAYVLAGELRRAGGDYREAFRNYERRLAPMLSRKQDAAERFAGSFAPRSAFKLLVRNQASKLLSIPIVADWALGRDLMDPIPLPEYRQ